MFGGLLDAVKGKFHIYPPWQEDSLAHMVHIIREGGKNCLFELLDYLSPMYGEGSVLSVVDSFSRDVIASTQSEDLEQLRAVAMSLKEVTRKGYYLKHEKSSVCFRSGFSCIRYVPLYYHGICLYVLMIEQIKNQSFGADRSDRCMDLLTIAVYLHMNDVIARNASFTDTSSGLPNREQFVKDAERCLNRECDRVGQVWIGLLAFYGRSGFTEEDIGYQTGMLKRVLALLRSQYKGEVYCINSCALGILVEGDAFESSTTLYDIMDCCATLADISLCAAVTPLTKDVRRELYLCESAVLGQTEEGVVAILREDGSRVDEGKGVKEDTCKSETGDEYCYAYDDFETEGVDE